MLVRVLDVDETMGRFRYLRRLAIRHMCYVRHVSASPCSLHKPFARVDRFQAPSKKSRRRRSE